MRLIDGDALCVHIEEEFDGVCVYDVSGNEAAREFCDMVDIAPTIDAIPVEWLKQKRDSQSDPWDYLANAIDYIIAVYSKEQEAQDGRV